MEGCFALKSAPTSDDCLDTAAIGMAGTDGGVRWERTEESVIQKNNLGKDKKNGGQCISFFL